MAPPATVVVQNIFRNQSGQPIPNLAVRCTLDYAFATVIATGDLITPLSQPAVTDQTGNVTFTVVPNDLINPANTVYTVQAEGQLAFQIAPQSTSGSPQTMTAAGVIVNAPLTLNPFFPSNVANTLTVNGLATANTLAMTVQTVAWAASITPNLALGAKVEVGTLTADTTIQNPTNMPPDGSFVIFVLTQDGVGGHAVTFGSAFPNAPTMPTGINAKATFLFQADNAGNLQLVGGSSTSTGVQSITAGTNVTLGGTGANPVINA